MHMEPGRVHRLICRCSAGAAALVAVRGPPCSPASLALHATPSLAFCNAGALLQGSLFVRPSFRLPVRMCGIIGVYKHEGNANVEIYEGLLMLQVRTAVVHTVF